MPALGLHCSRYNTNKKTGQFDTALLWLCMRNVDRTCNTCLHLHNFGCTCAYAPVCCWRTMICIFSFLVPMRYDASYKNVEEWRFLLRCDFDDNLCCCCSALWLIHWLSNRVWNLQMQQSMLRINRILIIRFIDKVDWLFDTKYNNQIRFRLNFIQVWL